MSLETQPLLTIRQLGCATEEGTQIFSNVELTVNEGDVVVIQGKSGCGKTTFLKCLAHLNVYGGDISFRGKTPQSYGIPAYRTKIAYVPQRPPLLPGTPRDFLSTVSAFKARSKKKSPIEDLEYPIELASFWGIEVELWDREWSNLSGGETQRIALAISIGLDTAEVLLLDEPTSALDNESCLLVERHILDTLKSNERVLKAVVWITHSPEQASRVSTRFVHFSGGSAFEELIPQV